MSDINELRAKPGSSCTLCKDSTSDDHQMGQLLSGSNDDNAYHHYCLLFSSGLRQEGEDAEGILGFLPQDINKEVFRGKKLACSHCGKRGATVGCFNGRCRKSYHMSCGLKHSAQFSFLGEFRSWCEDHRMFQKGPGVGSMSQCQICLDDLPADPKEALWAPCCQKDLWYHKQCMQNLAMSSGYYFKCPMCNDKKSFVRTMQQFGIYVPEKDASWELEPNAYDDLLERPSRCEAAVCLSEMGREYDEEHTPWDILYCDLCGSSGIHKSCMAWVGFNVWQCIDCIQHTADITKRDRLKYQEEMKKLEEEKKEEENINEIEEGSEATDKDDVMDCIEKPTVSSNESHEVNDANNSKEDVLPEENQNYELIEAVEKDAINENVQKKHCKLFNLNKGEKSDLKNEVPKYDLNLIKEENDLLEENEATDVSAAVASGTMSHSDDELEISFKSVSNEGSASLSDLSVNGFNRRTFSDIHPLGALEVSQETLEKFGSVSLRDLLDGDNVSQEIIKVKEHIIAIMKHTVELSKSTFSLGKVFKEFGIKSPSNTVYNHFLCMTMKLSDTIFFAKVIQNLIEFVRLRVMQSRRKKSEATKYKQDADAILFLERNKHLVSREIVRKESKRLLSFLKTKSNSLELLNQSYPLDDAVESLEWRGRISFLLKKYSSSQSNDENVTEKRDETSTPVCDDKEQENSGNFLQNGMKRLSSDSSLQSLTNQVFDSVKSSKKKFKFSDTFKTTQSSITSFFTK